MEESARRAALSDLYSLPGHLLWRSSARVGAEIALLLPGRADLHAYAALQALAQDEPLSQQRLANMCGVSGTTMTSVAEALQRDGLAERLRNPDDRRSYALTRTTAGRAAVRRWEPDVRGLEARLTAPLTDTEVLRLRRHLSSLVGDQLDERTPQALLDSTGFLITRSHAVIHRELLTALEPLGIEPRHFGTMRALRAAGQVTQGQLGALLDVSPASVVQIVDHLEDLGLVERQRDPADRRAYRLHLLPPSAAVLAEASAVADTLNDDRYGGPRTRPRVELVRLLQKFLAAPVDH
ncbi:MarR family transcriptional regulator [Nocardioides panacis]|uniref:MarR family transcriptional regulator n=1 Tax=Nocardioides panacis TaxID=2849501 RepID=A0A975SX78_9ACTN|nr:MarR family transcriptional regulator [Nocardioides panacis]QWZ07541.1 MarR family transcriptional regulator [Nocardioides panacis]